MKHPITGLDHSPMICSHHHTNAGQCMQCDKQRLNTTGRNIQMKVDIFVLMFFCYSIYTWTTYKNKHNDSC